MKLPLTPAGAAACLARLRRSGRTPVVLCPDGKLLSAPAGLALLREAADLCIERGRPVTIVGAAPCLLPGYVRYIAPAGPGALSCPRRPVCFLAPGCGGIPASQAAAADIFTPPPRSFSDLEKCMLAILSRKSGLTTAQVLKAAKGIKICASCSNEGEVFRAAERLIKFGLVKKEYRGGVYLWSKIPV